MDGGSITPPTPPLHPVQRDIGLLCGLDIDTASTAAVADALGRVRRVRGWVDALEAQLLTRARVLHQAGESTDPAELARRSGGLAARDARRVAERAETLAAVPVFHDALHTGTVTTGHVDVLHREIDRATPAVADKLRDLAPQLVTEARRSDVDTFARTVRARALLLDQDLFLQRFEAQHRASRLRKWIARDTGMHHLHLELDPERGATVSTALDAEVRAMRAVRDLPFDGADTDHIAAQALVNLTARGNTAVRRNDPELVVVIDETTLRSGRIGNGGQCHTDHGQPLPIATVRRMACTAGIIPVVLDGDGMPLDVGRTARLATWAQRAALRAMWPTCTITGCDVPYGRCHIHHLHPYEVGGRTDLDNLTPLCTRHHHLVHEGRWTLQRCPTTGKLQLHRPDGTLDSVSDLPSRDRTEQRRQTHNSDPPDPNPRPSEPPGAPRPDAPLRAGPSGARPPTDPLLRDAQPAEPLSPGPLPPGPLARDAPPRDSSLVDPPSARRTAAPGDGGPEARRSRAA